MDLPTQSPADLVQATQDGPHPASDSKRIKSMKATRIPPVATPGVGRNTLPVVLRSSANHNI